MKPIHQLQFHAASFVTSEIQRRFCNGSFYIGGFDSDSYQGTGTLVLTDGTVQAGTWVNGMRVRDADGKLLPDPLEIGVLAQGRLLDAALAAVPPSTGAVELYTLAFQAVRPEHQQQWRGSPQSR